MSGLRTLMSRLRRIEAARSAPMTLDLARVAELRDFLLKEAAQLEAAGDVVEARETRELALENFALIERLHALLRGEAVEP